MEAAAPAHISSLHFNDDRRHFADVWLISGSLPADTQYTYGEVGVKKFVNQVLLDVMRERERLIMSS